MRKFLIVLITTAVFLCGCGSEKRKNYVILIDNSASLTDATYNNIIRIIRESILPNLGLKDKLTIQFIDECSISKSERVYTLDFSHTDLTRKTDGINHEQDSAIARFKKIIADSISIDMQNKVAVKRKERKDCNQFTDIIDAICKSNDLLTDDKSFKTRTDEIVNDAKGDDNYEYENCLIIFSDMINDDRAKEYCFNKMQNFSADEIKNRIIKAKNADQIPNLKGTKVFVYGATSTKNAGANSVKQIENIKLFWQLYFDQAKASLEAYNYDTEKEITDYALAKN